MREFIDLAVSKAIALSLKDSKMVEIETAERIWDRLWKWAKTFGIIMGILLTTFAGILGLFGYSNYKQVITAINEAQTNFQSQSKVLTERLNTLNQTIAERERVVGEFDKRFPALEKRLADYDIKLPDLASIVTLIANSPEIAGKLNKSPETKAKLESVKAIGWGAERELSREEQQKIEVFLAPYRAYLTGIGFRGISQLPVTELVDPKSAYISEVSGGRMYLGSKVLQDQELIFRTQIIAALVGSRRVFLWPSVFFALYKYFPAAFLDKEFNNRDNLKFPDAPPSDLTINSDLKIKAASAWESLFWEMRKSIGKEVTDSLLCAAWIAFSEVTSDDSRLESRPLFLKKLIEADHNAYQGKNSDKIRALFEGRGIKSD